MCVPYVSQSIMKREVTQFKRQHIKQGTALGELNHPSYYSSYFRSLNLPNVSHQVRVYAGWRQAAKHFVQHRGIRRSSKGA